MEAFLKVNFQKFVSMIYDVIKLRCAERFSGVFLKKLGRREKWLQMVFLCKNIYPKIIFCKIY